MMYETSITKIEWTLSFKYCEIIATKQLKVIFDSILILIVLFFFFFVIRCIKLGGKNS